MMILLLQHLEFLGVDYKQLPQGTKELQNEVNDAPLEKKLPCFEDVDKDDKKMSN